MILVIFVSQWLILLIISTNLLILYIINACEFVTSNRKLRIKILMDIVKKIDSLWINTLTCISGNVLNDDLKQCLKVINRLKSTLRNLKLSNDITILTQNMIMISKMVCNNNNKHLFLILYSNSNDDCVVII